MGLTDKEARKESRHVESILKDTGAKGREIYQIGSKSMLDRIEANFVDRLKKEGSKKASTIKNYIRSLWHYGNYLFEEKVSEEDFWRDERDMLDLRKKKWFKMLNSQHRRESVKKRVEEIDNMSSPLDVQTFFACDKSQEMMRKLRGEEELPTDKRGRFQMSGVLQVRDFLLTAVISLNGLRPSGILNMTGEELLKAKFYSKSKNYIVKVCLKENGPFSLLNLYCTSYCPPPLEFLSEVIFQVLEHKTVEFCGEVNVGLTTELFEMVKFFYNHVRSKLKIEVDHDYIFFTRTGDMMNNNMFSKIVNKSFEESGCAKRTSCTSLRKMHSSTVIYLLSHPFLSFWFLLLLLDIILSLILLDMHREA